MVENKGRGKITPEVAERILTLSVSMGDRAIERALKEEGISVSHVSIGKFLKSIRDERAEMTKQIVQDHLQVSLPSDLELLQAMRDELAEMRLDKNLRLPEKVAIYRELKQLIDTKMKYSGVGEQEQKVTIKWESEDGTDDGPTVDDMWDGLGE